MNIIESKSNPKIKNLKKLIADRKYRYSNKEYVIEGIRALKDVDVIKEIFVCEGRAIPKVVAGKTYIVEKNCFKYISSTENSQGVLAVVPLKVLNSSEIRKDLKYVLLDRLQDPGNMGTIIRTAAAFNLNGIILTPGCVDPFSPKTARASAGCITKTNVINIKKMDEIKGFNIIGADLKGEDIAGFQWPNGYILCIGNESVGLSAEVKVSAKVLVSIPISNSVESLNAGISLGIILYCATMGKGGQSQKQINLT